MLEGLSRKFRYWGRRRNGGPPQAADALFIKRQQAAFAKGYGQVAAACAVLEPESRVFSALLAGKYMTRVLREERTAAWWRAHGEHAAQPWFIWAYSCSHGLCVPPEAQNPPLPLLVIRPETPVHAGCVRLRLQRRPLAPDQGLLRVDYPGAADSFGMLMRTQGLEWTEEGFCRTIGEEAAPLFDRGVACALSLLEAGYSLCVEESALKEAICQRRFQPEQRYWVAATPQPDMLRLSYPREPRLHSYLRQAGARWNGRFMEIAVCHGDKLEELMRLYGFRATQEARRRLDAWREALAQATVYRPRRSKGQAAGSRAEDRFKMILSRSADVLDDLREPYE